MNTRILNRQRYRMYLRLVLGGLLALCGTSLFGLATPVTAAASLTVTPITWNVVGLDSNNVNVGPNNFPVGARVCNSGPDAATNLVATLVWDSSDPYIDVRAGSQNPITWSSLASGACKDVYFEVSVVRNSNAYNHARRYRITVTADGGVSASTPAPREIFVEHLISQNRNATHDVKLDGVSIPPGGSMTLVVGNTYNITLNVSTATQGYEQIESFINFPNTIFRVNSVTTTYSADSGTDPYAATKVYADGCKWENNPLSPNYRACLSTGKYGGTVTIVYNVTIIGGAGTSQTLSTLIYDFSGSSYHYNADFSTAFRIANIVGPSSVTIAKRFVPDSITPGGTSQLIFTLNNPFNVSISGVNFTDSLPGGVTVASTPGISYIGCGSGAFSGPPGGGATSLTFQNGTIAPNSSCIIKINVTAASVGTYNNTTGNLYINTSTNTGNTASATLTVANATQCTPGQTMARWSVPAGATAPPDTTGGAPTFKASNVVTATASTLVGGSNSQIVSDSGAPDGYAWSVYPFVNTSSQYVQFVVDTRHYSNVVMQLAVKNPGGGNGPTDMYIGYMNGPTFTPVYTNTNMRYSGWLTHTAYFTGVTSASTATTFRIVGSGGANNQNGGLYFDNIVFTGCSSAPPPPTITKAFSPDTIPTNTVSTLTFTIRNTQDGYENLTNVTFNDPLPIGLEVANPPSSSTSGSGCTGVTFAPTAGATTLTYTASSMAAGAICTAQVNVRATKAGQFENISGYIGATESGQNKTSTGYAVASLTAIAPPSIAKQYSTSPIFVGNTTVLTYTLFNPNPSTTLTGVAFTDSLPAGLSVATASSSTCGGTLTTTSPGSISFSGGSIAGGSSCTFTVTVTGTSAGVYTHTTSNVTSTNGGTGNTATATVQVRTQTPGLALLKKVGPSDTGPWTPFIVRQVGQPVYFQFTVENIGDVALTNVTVQDPPGGSTVCNIGGLSVYSYTTCITGPAYVTSTERITNTAQATSTQANSAYSSASHWTQNPTAVRLSRFSAHQADAGLFMLGIGGLVMIVVLALGFTRKQSFK